MVVILLKFGCMSRVSENHQLKQYLQSLLKDDYSAFIKARPEPRAVRVNQLKYSGQNFENDLKRWSLKYQKIKFHDYGYVLENDVLPLSHTLQYLSGKFFYQGISSQLPVELLSIELRIANNYACFRAYILPGRIVSNPVLRHELDGRMPATDEAIKAWEIEDLGSCTRQVLLQFRPEFIILAEVVRVPGHERHWLLRSVSVLHSRKPDHGVPRITILAVTAGSLPA